MCTKCVLTSVYYMPINTYLCDSLRSLLIARRSDPKKFSHLTSYVQQDDAMFAALTVKETLMTAAHFQMSSKVSTAEKEKYVMSIVAELGLNKVANTKIGDARERGVSGGGERVRGASEEKATATSEARCEKRRLSRS